ncbi:MAG: hypothetical protein SCH39_02800 [Methanosarcinales archaeon]|nr:hypothetical protein [Methanosarcinales archaeon]
MARILSSRDLELLVKMVPELDTDISKPGYRSLLSPISKHFSSSASEFCQRLDRLSGPELSYLTDLIFLGEECLTCLADEYLEILLDKIRRDISPQKAEDLMEFLGYIKEE